MTQLAIKKLVTRAQEIQRYLDKVKPLYGELDQITMRLKDHNESLTRFGCVIIDNFEDRNSAFKTTVVRRFELKLTPHGRLR